MQSSLTLSNNYGIRPEKSSRQSNGGLRKDQPSRYWLIGGGIITLPIVISLALLQWVVKQNWTMLPL